MLRALAPSCWAARSQPPVLGAGLGSVNGAMSVCVQPRRGNHTPPGSSWLKLNHQIHASTRSSAICIPGVTSAWSCRKKMSVDVARCRGTTAKSLFGLTSWRCLWRAATSPHGCVGVDVEDCPQFLPVKEVRFPLLGWSVGWGGHGLQVLVLCNASWAGVPWGGVRVCLRYAPCGGLLLQGHRIECGGGRGATRLRGPEACVTSSSAPRSPASCLRCCGESSASRWFGCVTARLGSPMAHCPGCSGGRCPCPGLVLSRPACGGRL